jgi:predicted HicB family RNase H-like nuclease
MNMNTMSYKGYIGSISFSEKDDVFYGKVEGIDGLVNFEGRSVDELKTAFHEAVDEYIEYCVDNGIKAHKSYTGNLNVRISAETHSRIAFLAARAGISINAFIKDALDQKVASMM